MALVAVDAVVDIPPNSLMTRVSGGLGVARSICARKNRVIVWIRVAGGAHAIGIAVIEAPPGVAESRPGPSGGVVARCASGREDRRRRFMDGVGSAVVIRGVAAVAVGG